MSIKLSSPVTAAIAPDLHDVQRWGVFQFPNIWRGEEDNRLYLRVNMGEDTYGTIGFQNAGMFFVSDDDGESWQSISETETDQTPETICFPDGERVRFGRKRWIYHQRLFCCDDERYHLINEMELDSIGSWLSPNLYGRFSCYRYMDIPLSIREFAISRQQADENIWHEEKGVLDFPELLIPVASGSRLGLNEEWTELETKIWVFSPQGVVLQKNGDLVCVVHSQKPGITDRSFDAVYCVASSDRGRTWSLKGTIADNTEISKWGYGVARGLGDGEHSLITTDDGTLLCAMRTDLSGKDGCRATLLSRSTDAGATWSEPIVVASSSVTPHLIAFDKKNIALVHGRPGVHIKLSCDNGLTWPESTTVIGPTNQELLKNAKSQGLKSELEYYILSMQGTCANTSVIKNNDGTFLLAYSYFKHSECSAPATKAIKICHCSLS